MCDSSMRCVRVLYGGAGDAAAAHVGRTVIVTVGGADGGAGGDVCQ
jgi:hypothetical protein